MTNTEQLAALLADAGIPFEKQVPLAPYTTFRIGGPAAVFCRPKSTEQLRQVLALAKKAGVRHYLLGKGSNTLFADAGFDGLVVHLAKGEVRRDPKDPCILEADMGVNLTGLCRMAEEWGLSGLEFAYGIPGSVGGAVYMNAGAYGGEMKDVVFEVDWMDGEGAEHTLSGEQLGFGYRTSRFEKEGGIILRARMRLVPAERELIRAKMDDLLARRVDKQPLDKPSAGSTFKRPQGAFAAALIDECGLKGYQIGGAAVSEKHAGFVVNMGGATCADVVAVADHAARVVKEKTGYDLEREIRVVE